MILRRVFRENWITRPPVRNGVPFTFALVLLMVLGFFVWLPASPDAVFRRGEIWRAWSALFMHQDLGHLLGNLLLFIPFSFALTRTYSLFFFPLVGFIVGGLVNLAVLTTLPSGATLVGVSGVVFWMGAAWVTLGYLIDRRDSKGKRLIKAVGVSLLLFAPEAYHPEVSYLAHFLGYVTGVLCALAYYFLERRDFHRAERFDVVADFSDDLYPEAFGKEPEISSRESG